LITRIEIDGFKSFQDFKLELSPFQVIVGPNGAGKSNLFDALCLLKNLTEEGTLEEAFQKIRGGGIDAFTKLADGRLVNKICLAVEMLVDLYVEDGSVEAELKYTRMRYELEISRRLDELGLERFSVSYESLKTIPRVDDIWCKRHGLLTQTKWLPKLGSRGKRGGRSGSGSVPFISTEQNTILLHRDGLSGGTFTMGRVDVVNDHTVLSRGASIERPHVFAARKEIRSWKILQLNPDVLREPSPINAPASLSARGHNLATTLVRMRTEDPFLINDVSCDLASLVPGMLKVELDTDQARNRHIVRATTQDQTSFSSESLSDGTLRMLALATLRNDPEQHGVLCLEEPENGVHPSRFQRVARVLRDLATNFQDEDQAQFPLRQLIVSTHSPTFVSQTEVRDALLFAYVVTLIRPPREEIPPQYITRIIPVIRPDTQALSDFGVSQEAEAYTLDQIKDYLNSDSLDDAVQHIVAG